jgi:hypothetical protein
MANLLQSLKDVLAKAGLSENLESVAKLLQSEQVKSLENVEIDASISNLLNKNLITVEGAKSHGDVSAHFKKSYFGSIDSALKSSLIELGIAEDVIAEIEKNPTDKRISEALKKAVEIKGKNTSNQEISELRAKLQEYQNTAKSEKEQSEKAIREAQKQIQDLHKNYAVKQSLGSYKFIDGLTQSQAEILMQAEIEKTLLQKGALLQYENGLLKLRSIENPDLEYFEKEKGKTIEFSEFLNEVVAKSNLQKTAEQSNANQGNAGGFQGGATQTGFTEFQKKAMGIGNV